MRALVLTLVLVPAVAVAVAATGPEEYRSKASVAFSGRNTGYVARDVEQARLTIQRDLSLAARTLDVTGVTGTTAEELQDALEVHRRPGRLEIAVNRDNPVDAQMLCDEFSFQLARDQRARVVSTTRSATKVAPRLLEVGLLGLALAIPLGVALATALETLRRRGPRLP